MPLWMESLLKVVLDTAMHKFGFITIKISVQELKTSLSNKTKKIEWNYDLYI